MLVVKVVLVFAVILSGEDKMSDGDLGGGIKCPLLFWKVAMLIERCFHACLVFSKKTSPVPTRSHLRRCWTSNGWT